MTVPRSRSTAALAAVRAALWIALGALCGCAGIRSDGGTPPATDLVALGTYAWAAPSDATASLAPDGAVFERLRRAVDDGLAARGMRRVPEPLARVRVVPHLAVRVRTVHNDPFYAFYTLERLEEGTLSLEFLDAARGAPLWQGAATTRLRVVERGFGTIDPQIVRTDEERSWPIEAMADSVLAALPAAAPR